MKNQSKMQIPARNVYAICLQKSEKEADLREMQTLLQSQNGAGYVFKQNDKFLLLASLYENANDAELVKNNLCSSGTNCEVVCLTLEKVSIDGKFSSQQKSALEAAINCPFESYKKLYDVAISLDTNLVDKTAAKLQCNAVFSSVVQTEANFDTFFENKSKFKQIKQSLIKTKQAVQVLLNEEGKQTQTFSSMIKMCYFKILFD